MKAKSWILALGCGALLLCGPARAQEDSQDTPSEVEQPRPAVEVLTEPTGEFRLNALKGDPVELTLRDVVLQTLMQNLDIKISKKDRDIAAEQVFAELGIYDPVFEAGVTRTQIDEQSRTLPQNRWTVDEKDTQSYAALSQRTPWGTMVTLEFTDHRQHILDRDPRVGNTLSPSYRQTAGVTVTQPLLKNFGPLVNNANIRIAKRRLDQSNEAFRGQIMDQLASVMGAYWELVFTIRNLDVQEQALASARELERVNKARVDVGSLPRLSLVQAQAEVAYRESLVVNAESAVAQAQDNLLQLMNWDRTDLDKEWNRPIIPVDSPEFTPDVRFSDSELINVAFARRPDFLAAVTELDVAHINRDVSKRQRLPELNVFGSYTYSGLDNSRWGAFDYVDDMDYTDYSFGAEFRFPLFNRQARAQYHQSLDYAEQQELFIQQLEVAITGQVRASTRSVRTALRRIDATRKQVTADQEKLDAEIKRREVGERTTFDVLDFQDDLAQSQASEARAMVDYQIAMIELARSTGTLLDAQNILVDDQVPPGGFDLGFQPVSTDSITPEEVDEAVPSAQHLLAPLQ
ncbi:TolC family protein [bacterium]|nr:TolC family protein [bacterium]